MSRLQSDRLTAMICMLDRLNDPLLCREESVGMYAIREVQRSVSGKISIEIPEFLRKQEVEIIVLPIEKSAIYTEWPDHFFDETVGCFADAPLVRELQGDYSNREDF